MSELQAALEFQVELSKFYNVDLFQRGYYQIRCSLKNAPKAPVKVEVSLPKNSECSLAFPASLINGVAVSKTFHILYRNEDILINDVIVFKVYMLVDAQRILQSIEEAEFQLNLELWFTDEEVGRRGVVSPDQMEKFQCIVTRVLKLHFSPSKGLHHHAPVLFDYFHLAVVSVTVHGMLLALQQPYINLQRQLPKTAYTNKNPSTMESVIFGSSTMPSTNNSYALSPRLQQACYVHTHICGILLLAYDSLQNLIHELIDIIPAKTRPSIEFIDCGKKLEKLRNIAQSHSNEEELFQVIQTSIAQVCAQNVILWSQFIDIVTLKREVTHRLAKEHHQQRIQRFSEAFFYNHMPKQNMLACFEPSVHGNSDVASMVRSSTYFQSIPPLAMECTEIDGDENSLPIIFEDIYCEQPTLRRFHVGSDENVNNHSINQISRSNSSRSTSSSSPSRTRKLSRKKIPKNLKLDTLKRPSSMYAQEISNQVASEANRCTLVGYKKLNNAETPIYTVPSISVELGTLSPAPKYISNTSDISLLFSAVSMPALLGRSGLNSANSGSMPELSAIDEPDNKSNVRQSLSADLEAQLRLDKLIAGADMAKPEIYAKCEDLSNADDPLEKNSVKNDKLEQKSSPVIANSEEDATANDDLPHCVLGQQDSSESDEGVGPIENGYIASSPSSIHDNSPPGGLSLSDRLTDSDSGSHNRVDYDLAQSLTDTMSEPEKSSDTDLSEVDDSSKKKYIPRPELGQTSTPQAKKQTNSSDTDAKNSFHGENSDDKKNASHNDSGLDCTVLELLRDEFEKSKLMSSSGPVGSTQSLIVQRTSSYNRRYDPSARASTSVVTSYVATSPVARRLDLHRPAHLTVSASLPELSTLEEDKSKKLVGVMADKTISFKIAKDSLKKQLKYEGQWYSSQSTFSSSIPYFWPAEIPRNSRMDEGIHLIICVHGLDGNSADLRLVRTYLEMALPGEKIDFLMSEKNQVDTFTDFDVMTEKLVQEIFYHLEMYGLDPARVSFVGHSLGNLIIRSALAHPQMALLLPKLHTLLSLSGPHLGTLYNTSGLVNMGMWFMQKWKKSGSLLQLSLKDHADPRQTFLYKLSQKTGLEFFQNILLVGSQQDRYVPYHSSRIELCKAAVRDTTGVGSVYAEMVSNILQPIVYKSDITFIRYDVFHALPSNANTMIGRAAHIAVLDSELFIEKLLTVSVLKYFK